MRNGHYLVIPAGEVRDICGFKTLKKYVAGVKIPILLGGVGLNVWEDKLPTRQTDLVLLYVADSYVGTLLSIASGMTENLQQVLRRLKIM